MFERRLMINNTLIIISMGIMFIHKIAGTVLLLILLIYWNFAYFKRNTGDSNQIEQVIEIAKGNLDNVSQIKDKRVKDLTSYIRDSNKNMLGSAFKVLVSSDDIKVSFRELIASSEEISTTIINISEDMTDQQNRVNLTMQAVTEMEEEIKKQNQIIMRAEQVTGSALNEVANCEESAKDLNSQMKEVTRVVNDILGISKELKRKADGIAEIVGGNNKCC